GFPLHSVPDAALCGGNGARVLHRAQCSAFEVVPKPRNRRSPFVAIRVDDALGESVVALAVFVPEPLPTETKPASEHGVLADLPHFGLRGDRSFLSIARKSETSRQREVHEQALARRSPSDVRARR